VDQVGTRIVIFLSEDDRTGHRGLHEALLERAREDGMAGATVWKGVEGFGSSGHIRTNRFAALVTGMPVALEVIDLPERIEAFLPTVRELAPGSLVTKEQVHMTRITPSPAHALDDPTPKSGPRA
jgi:PII-like signaling protein